MHHIDARHYDITVCIQWTLSVLKW